MQKPIVTEAKLMKQKATRKKPSLTMNSILSWLLKLMIGRRWSRLLSDLKILYPNTLDQLELETKAP